MNIKEQVLSIDQVQELQELGFDVEKLNTPSMVYDNEFKIITI